MDKKRKRDIKKDLRNDGNEMENTSRSKKKKRVTKDKRKHKQNQNQKKHQRSMFQPLI